MDFKLFGKKALDFITTPIEEDANITILEGSVRSGKTVAMIPKLLNYVEHAPDGLILLAGATKTSIYDNVLNDLFDTVGKRNYAYNKNTGDLRIGKRRLRVLGAKDEGSEKFLRGKTLAGAYVDELSLTPESFFNQLLARLSLKGAKLYGTTNPDTPYHYLYTKWLTNEEKLNSGDLKVIHFELEDNPSLDPDVVRRLKSNYKGLWYKRMILGQWVIADGAIYDMFNQTLHSIPVNFDMYHNFYIGIDYGVQNTMAYVLIGEDILRPNHWVVLKEWGWNGRAKERQKDNEEYHEDLVKFADGFKIKHILIDPSALSFIATIRKHGKFKVRQADNEVISGITRTQSMISTGRLLFGSTCTETFKELYTYSWDDKKVIEGKDVPLKKNDHYLDAIRYVVNTVIGVNLKIKASPFKIQF